METAYWIIVGLFLAWVVIGGVLSGRRARRDTRAMLRTLDRIATRQHRGGGHA